ncbi:hypothetical protein K431DRAFT_80908 [Polychaeton citri CBS 116435]|uniref:Uncharacterized protein n=1 Tax=Polychaeton citri CBS 116435 TaxID=1314669 RepID=A0A9P4QIZ6_9PEZI|nr:hypothetical protein K431DRAFT_80908 [Polychaeton citri CBS 116435]
MPSTCPSSAAGSACLAAATRSPSLSSSYTLFGIRCVRSPDDICLSDPRCRNDPSGNLCSARLGLSCQPPLDRPQLNNALEGYGQLFGNGTQISLLAIAETIPNFCGGVSIAIGNMDQFPSFPNQYGCDEITNGADDTEAMPSVSCWTRYNHLPGALGRGEK